MTALRFTDFCHVRRPEKVLLEGKRRITTGYQRQVRVYSRTLTRGSLT